VIVQLFIDHFRGKSTEYLGVVGIIAYLVALIMVIPYVQISNGFSSVYYSLLHLVIIGGGAVVFALLSLVSREMNKRDYKGYHYFIFVVGIMIIGLVFLSNIFQIFYCHDEKHHHKS